VNHIQEMEPLAMPVCIAVNDAMNIYISDNNAHSIYSYNSVAQSLARFSLDAKRGRLLYVLRKPWQYKVGRGASFKTYLCVMARNLVYKRFRYDAFETGLEQLAETETSYKETETSYKLLDRLIAKEDAHAVRIAVGQLSPLQRESLILFEYEGLSLAEIAEIVGTDVGAVKSRLHRARASLRTKLLPRFKAAELTAETCL
ncbi:MAG: sigma-70 family RNA polymerase sigma factor, partial [Methylococcales bacterium]